MLLPQFGVLERRSNILLFCITDRLYTKDSNDDFL